ncbi:MAG: type IV conjugative transfer system protein TraL [Alphaproteobacteria bacterium]|jgi:conjugal transfer pilus assembly protein TraL|nr:type IV conjugative transfer system protein TraL [Alphaproteobacteria bacterium]
MNEYETFYIPQTLDEPDRILIFEPDEGICFLGLLFYGLLFNQFIMGLVSASVCVWALKRLKGSEQPNLPLYAVYWFLPRWMMRLKATPPSFIRFYIG